MPGVVVVVVAGRVRKIMAARGYGFLETQPPTNDIFFHATALVGVRMSELQEGDEMEFELHFVEGRYKAMQVKRIQGGSDAHSFSGA